MTAPIEPAPEEVDLLFVCEANVCRSPFAEAVVRAGLEPLPGAVAAPLRIGSAGCRARTGVKIDPVMAGLVRAFGGSSDNHASRRVDAAMLASAAMVVTATRAQRSAVVELHPGAVRYSFTVRQVERLLRDAPVAASHVGGGRQGLRELVEVIARRRGAEAPNDELDDVVDPWGAAPAVYRRAAHEMVPGLNLLCLSLGGRGVVDTTVRAAQGTRR